MRSFRKTMMATSVAFGCIAATAHAVSARPLQDAPSTVVRPGDGDMTCRQMADEGAALSADMGASGPGLLGRVGGIARAGATLLVPGAGLAVAGAEALASSGKARREAEADARRDRWNYLNGLYAGRGCDESDAQVTPATVPPPAAPPTGAATPSPTATPGPVAAPRPSITPAAFPH